MNPAEPTGLTSPGPAERAEPAGTTAAEPDFRLKRWLVSFGCGTDWYPVGEFVAADSETAIERAVAVFGCGESHRAEEIPWDAAPLHKPAGR
jgi:hypothetical protein